MKTIIALVFSKKLTYTLVAICIGFGFWISDLDFAYADELWTNDQIANAIYKAEGGIKTSHPYGIMTHYKHTTPRQACLNTIASAHKRFEAQTKETDFIHFLSLTYCPIGASNDPTGLNVNWEWNVKYFLGKEE